MIEKKTRATTKYRIVTIRFSILPDTEPIPESKNAELNIGIGQDLQQDAAYQSGNDHIIVVVVAIDAVVEVTLDLDFVAVVDIDVLLSLLMFL